MGFKYHIYADEFQIHIFSPDLFFPLRLKYPTTWVSQTSQPRQVQEQSFSFPPKSVCLSLVFLSSHLQLFSLPSPTSLPFLLPNLFLFVFHIPNSSSMNLFLIYLHPPKLGLVVPPATFRVALIMWYGNGCILPCLSLEAFWEADPYLLREYQLWAQGLALSCPFLSKY